MQGVLLWSLKLHIEDFYLVSAYSSHGASRVKQNLLLHSCEPEEGFSYSTSFEDDPVHVFHKKHVYKKPKAEIRQNVRSM